MRKLFIIGPTGVLESTISTIRIGSLPSVTRTTSRFDAVFGDLEVLAGEIHDRRAAGVDRAHPHRPRHGPLRRE